MVILFVNMQLFYSSPSIIGVFQSIHRLFIGWNDHFDVKETISVRIPSRHFYCFIECSSLSSFV